MAKFIASDVQKNVDNLLYVQTNCCEVFSGSDCKVNILSLEGRAVLTVEISDRYRDIVKTEMADKISEVIAVKYKYDFLKEKLKFTGLNADEREILYASLISADLEEDKKYVFSKIKEQSEIAIDGVFNFKLKLLKKKWEEVVSIMPTVFIPSQLKDFVFFLLENKKRRVYVENGRVYDSHFRPLKRTELIGKENVKIIREILMSDCGTVELLGSLPEKDEFYLKEFYRDKIIFSTGYSN